MKKILALCKKELLQFKRDKKLRAIILIAPILQLILLGYAATLEIKIIRVGILDYDKSELSRNFINKINSSNYFKLEKFLKSQNQIDLELKDKLDIIFVVPKNFEANIIRNENFSIQAIIDAADGNKANIVSAYASNLIADFYNKTLLDINPRLVNKSQLTPINRSVKFLFNPYLETRAFMLPAILGLILMIVNVALMSMATVKEKESGSLEQILVAPIGKFQFIAGKTLPFLILSLIPATFQLLVIKFWFQIDVKGDILFLYASLLSFIASNIGLGLLVSSVSQSQFQAMVISFFGIMLPILYISGFAFPVENMPKIIQIISHLLPAKYFLSIIRGVILKGSSLSDLLVEFIALTLIGAAILSFSIVNFKKKIN